MYGNIYDLFFGYWTMIFYIRSYFNILFIYLFIYIYNIFVALKYGGSGSDIEHL